MSLDCKWYVYYIISISHVTIASILLSGCMWDGPLTKKEMLQFKQVLASEVSETRRPVVVFMWVIHLCVLLVEVVRLWHVRCAFVHELAHRKTHCPSWSTDFVERGFYVIDGLV